MSASRTKFYLDKQDGKILGVCAGIANYTGIDPLLVRIGTVFLTIIGGFPWTVIAYFLTAWLAPNQPVGALHGPRGREVLAALPRQPQALDRRCPLQVPRHRPPPGRHRADVRQPQQHAVQRDRPAALIVATKPAPTGS